MAALVSESEREGFFYACHGVNYFRRNCRTLVYSEVNICGICYILAVDSPSEAVIKLDYEAVAKAAEPVAEAEEAAEVAEETTATEE